ncbi:hypothetical protein ACA910_011445 [Epithemia clementina (nom. ined.)]
MHCSEHQLYLSNLPPLGFAFRTEPFDESSDGSFESCVSACSTFHSRQSADFSLGQSSYDHPPVGSAPTQQAWSTSLPPSVIHAAPLSSTDSSILQEAFDCVTLENDRLSRDLRALSDKVQLLLTASQRRKSAPASTSAPGLSPTDIENFLLPPRNRCKQLYNKPRPRRGSRALLLTALQGSNCRLVPMKGT